MITMSKKNLIFEKFVGEIDNHFKTWIKRTKRSLNIPFIHINFILKTLFKFLPTYHIIYHSTFLTSKTILIKVSNVAT